MLTSVSSTDLIRACQVLFNPDIESPFSFVKRLDADTLKTAFRKKALETHPDRAKAMGLKEQEQSRRFREVKQAYDVLLPLAEKPSLFSPNHRPSAKPSSPHPGQAHGHMRKSSFYTGIVPTHELKLGQFLYYSGVITWKQLIDAISWQKRIKPRYGQIAMEWNIIDHQQITDVLKGKKYGERFGEFARSCGYITDFQHLAIIGKQKKFHRLFGEYFLSQGILTQRQLDILLKRMANHNHPYGQEK